MHILYLDDSGSVGNPSDTHIILAGLTVFERMPHWLSQRLDMLAERIWPDSPQSIEFRGTDILSGKRHWRGINKEPRINAYKDALNILGSSNNVRIFAAAIHKAAVSPDDPMEFAFEHMCNRFDRYLGRLHKKGDTQRGLIVLDKSSYETSLQSLARDFRSIGHKWGQLYNLCDVPMFVDSKSTRMIQFADLIAHAMRRYYENGESQYFDCISGKFDAEGGVVHGLVHHTPKDAVCNCHTCRQR